MKNQKGISLVALIITIIVMVILAGIVIVSAVADGGVIDRAQAAIKENERADVQEIIIGSYVFKVTASTNSYAYLDLEKTGMAIYENLTANGFTVTNAEKTTDEEGNEVMSVPVTKDENENEIIDINVEGKHGNYTGTVTDKGLKEDIIVNDTTTGNVDNATGNTGNTTGDVDNTTGNVGNTTDNIGNTTGNEENNGLVFGKYYVYEETIKIMFPKDYDQCILYSSDGWGMWPYEYNENTRALKVPEAGLDVIVSENGESLEQDGIVMELTEETYSYEKFSFNNNEYYEGVYYNNTEGEQSYILIYIRESGSFDVNRAFYDSHRSYANTDLDTCLSNLEIIRIDSENLQYDGKIYTHLKEF